MSRVTAISAGAVLLLLGVLAVGAPDAESPPEGEARTTAHPGDSADAGPSEPARFVRPLPRSSWGDPQAGDVRPFLPPFR